MCVTLQASRARLEATVQQSMQHNVNHWAVAEVCDWSDYIGLGQYRKKFVHHCIDGKLLLRLSDRDLKVSAANARLKSRFMCMHATSAIAVLLCGQLEFSMLYQTQAMFSYEAQAMFSYLARQPSD